MTSDSMIVVDGQDKQGRRRTILLPFLSDFGSYRPFHEEYGFSRFLFFLRNVIGMFDSQFLYPSDGGGCVGRE